MKWWPRNFDEIVRVITLMDEKSHFGHDIAEIGLVFASADVQHPLENKRSYIQDNSSTLYDIPNLSNMRTVTRINWIVPFRCIL